MSPEEFNKFVFKLCTVGYVMHGAGNRGSSKIILMKD